MRVCVCFPACSVSLYNCMICNLCHAMPAFNLRLVLRLQVESAAKLKDQRPQCVQGDILQRISEEARTKLGLVGIISSAPSVAKHIVSISIYLSSTSVGLPNNLITRMIWMSLQEAIGQDPRQHSC